MFILDFAKVFDSVPHERLKAKLFRYGINGKTIAWISEWQSMGQNQIGRQSYQVFLKEQF